MKATTKQDLVFGLLFGIGFWISTTILDALLLKLVFSIYMPQIGKALKLLGGF